MKMIGNWIGGQESFGQSTRTSPVWNPASGAHQANVILTDAQDIDEAVNAALIASADWADSSLSTRARVLFAFREIAASRLDEMAEIISDEHGKVVADARGEVQRGLEVVEFACGIPQLLKGDYSDQVSSGVDAFSYRQPLGVVVGITPFNFPAMVPMWMFPLAIACGNSFILKPSERDPSISLVMAEIWKEAGLPDGVFNVVQGDVATVNHLLDHPDVAAVSFVGSTPIARTIYERATKTGKRVQALGGAKNHAVVLPDANLDYSADHLVAAAFGSAGERCMAISATVTVGSVGEQLLEKLSDRSRSLRVGPGRDSSSDMGPVITSAAKDRIINSINRGEQQGARVVVDGRGLTVAGYEGGYYVGPTILDNVTSDMDVYRDEIFGPVLSMIHADSVEEAIRFINANPYGNGTAIFTSSGDAARRFHRGVRVGMIGINVPIPVPMAYYSFGGWKDSLFGQSHIHGGEGIAFYTRAKAITSRWPHLNLQGDASMSFPSGS